LPTKLGRTVWIGGKEVSGEEKKQEYLSQGSIGIDGIAVEGRGRLVGDVCARALPHGRLPADCGGGQVHNLRALQRRRKKWSSNLC